jgi:hypothetical protein
LGGELFPITKIGDRRFSMTGPGLDRPIEFQLLPGEDGEMHLRFELDVPKQAEEQTE